MAPDTQGLIREILKNALQSGGLADALQGGGGSGESDGGGKSGSNGGGGMSGMKGLAAGAGAAALAPMAFKGAGKLAKSLGVDNVEDLVKSPGEALEGAKSNLGDRLTSTVTDKAKGAVDEAGGPGGMLKDAAKQMLPFGGGGGGGGKGGAEGVGKGRRMPIQQTVDIGIPIESVYNQFTQFEDWPQFMHRVKRATQEDDCTVSFAVKIWGKTKEFTAKIETQRPDQRIKWKSSQGMTHVGVVTFHELGPNLTRVILNFDVDPGSLVEKFARGARHVKRAARAELHRFVALIETAEHETGAWRGVIEDGELVEEHDPSYDEQREYSDIEDLTDQDEDEDEDEGDEDERGDDQSEDERGDDQSEDEEESPRARRGQAQQRQSGRASRSSSSGRGSSGGSSRSSSGGSSRSSSGRSSSGGSGRSSSSRSSSGGSGRSSSGRSSSGRSSSGRSSSGGSQTRSRSTRQSNNGGSASSRKSSGSRSSRGSSGGQSRSRSRSQSNS